MSTVSLPFDDGTAEPWEYPEPEGAEVAQEAAETTPEPEPAPAAPAPAPLPQGATVTSLSPFGTFEGIPIAAVEVKIKGEAKVESLAGIDVSVFDRARMVGEYTAVSVKHVVDKEGNLIRQVEFKVANLEIAPWDPADPTDDGILRARPHR